MNCYLKDRIRREKLGKGSVGFLDEFLEDLIIEEKSKIKKIEEQGITEKEFTQIFQSEPIYKLH